MLCRYYDAVTTVTMFLGSSKDYTDVYLAAAHGMLAGDPDAIVGGPGVAYNINSDRSVLCSPCAMPFCALPACTKAGTM